MQIGHRNLGGGNQEVLPLSFQSKQILGEFGELTGSPERIGIHDERRDDLAVAVLAAVEVEHEPDERHLQSCSGAGENGESGPGDLRRPLEVENAERFAELPVRLRFEGHLRSISPDPLHPVGALVRSGGNARMGNVRNDQLGLTELLVDLLEALVQRLDPIAQTTSSLDLCGGVLPGLLQRRDFLRCDVPLMLERLDVLDQFPTLLVELKKPIQIGVRRSPAVETCPDFVGRFT